MKSTLKQIGPGIVVAATGIGAGDMIAATVGGAKFGYVILWAVVVGGLLKFALNEGVGRWQLNNGTSLIEAWQENLPKFLSWYFLVYLILWTFVVAAALIAATGLAAHAIFPQLSVNTWGLLHSVVAVAIVFIGNYGKFEGLMKIMIGLMFAVVIVSVSMLRPDFQDLLSHIFIPVLPEGGVKYSLAIIGGVGGSVTILSYSYWISEKSWQGPAFLNLMRVDLAVAYILTTLFGIAIVILAADLEPETLSGGKIVIGLAEKMGTVTGSLGKWVFLIGFWGAVFSSMLGVWNGVPYIFADFIKGFQSTEIASSMQANLSTSKEYRIFLLLMASLPFSILLMSKPVWLIVLYSVVASLFMPYLAITLLYLNNKKSLQQENNKSIFLNILLLISVFLFLYLGVVELLEWI